MKSTVRRNHAERPPSVRRLWRSRTTGEAIGIDRRIAWESHLLDSTMGMSVAAFAATEGGFDGWHLRDQRTRSRPLSRPRKASASDARPHHTGPAACQRARRASNATAKCRDQCFLQQCVMCVRAQVFTIKRVVNMLRCVGRMALS